MIDRTILAEVNQKVSDLDAKNYEISALADFLDKVSGTVKCRINGQWNFDLPASIFADHFAQKKSDLEAEVVSIQDDIVIASSVLEATADANIGVIK